MKRCLTCLRITYGSKTYRLVSNWINAKNCEKFICDRFSNCEEIILGYYEYCSQENQYKISFPKQKQVESTNDITK